MHRRPMLPAAAAAAVAIVLSAGACAVEDPSSAPTTTVSAGETSPSPDAAGSVDIPAIVRSAEPSVVAVITAGGEGSGVIVDATGLIVTNAHVVGSAGAVEVELADGTRLAGRVTARDARYDLALVQVDRGDLPAARFATTLPSVGEPAVAIGSPLGFESTVTAGIVSGLERAIPGGGPALIGLIQTDAAISPGNSGGALLNAGGEVMGINVAYVPPQAGAVALGFAIPSVIARPAVEELRTTGAIEHAYLGITPRTMTPELAAGLGAGSKQGVLVLSVQARSPADTAGLEAGDVIVGIDGREVTSMEDLFVRLRDREPGDRLELEVVDGERREVSVELGTAP